LETKLITVIEHRDSEHVRDELVSHLSKPHYDRLYQKKRGDGQPCFKLKQTSAEEKGYVISTGYFIGVDWVEEGVLPLCVEPKLNTIDGPKVDYIQMLFEAMRHPEAERDLSDLFVIDWERPEIEITQQQDMLTPFLVVEFLIVLKSIVRKGLKKSYYRVERNLHSRVKGKVLVSATIKRNLLQNKTLHTYCQFEEFGLDNKENRLLKKALVFVQRYLPSYPHIGSSAYLTDTFNYINPAFHGVSEDITLDEIRHTKKNAFYKEYEQGIRLAKLILQRFGYNIHNTAKDTISTPPFWIDMSKLFELYVLGLLKKEFGSGVTYQFATHGNELDFLINAPGCQMVVDAKYIPKWDFQPVHENVRQVAGYARLERVYKDLGISDRDKNIDCLIIYPVKVAGKGIPKLLATEENRVSGYVGIYKLGVSVPWVAKSVELPKNDTVG
jgi:5-methylcytosine-specific restriction enzyme subunit McrC